MAFCGKGLVALRENTSSRSWYQNVSFWTVLNLLHSILVRCHLKISYNLIMAKGLQRHYLCFTRESFIYIWANLSKTEEIKKIYWLFNIVYMKMIKFAKLVSSLFWDYWWNSAIYWNDMQRMWDFYYELLKLQLWRNS